MKITRNLFSAFFCLVLVAGWLATVDAAEDDVSEMKAQIQALQQRVEELEAQQAQPATRQGPFNRRWDPFSELERMQEEMNRMFQGSFSQPGFGSTGMFSNDLMYDDNFQLEEKDNEYVITFDIGNLDKEKIDIEINRNSITLSGQYSEETEEDNPNGMFRSKRFGTFLKTIPLPTDADTEKMKTDQQEDVLMITLPKKA